MCVTEGVTLYDGFGVRLELATTQRALTQHTNNNRTTMAELLRLTNIPGIQKDKLGSPSTGSEDGGNGALDLAESNRELADQDEFDGPALPNGKKFGRQSHILM